MVDAEVAAKPKQEQVEKLKKALSAAQVPKNNTRLLVASMRCNFGNTSKSNGAAPLNTAKQYLLPRPSYHLASLQNCLNMLCLVKK